MLATLGLALLAGALSTLSPCVLPLLPIVLGTAAGQHRLGPAALAAGLCLSFAGIGLTVATLGQAVGLDAEAFRAAATLLLLALGLVLALPPLQARFQAGLALATGPVVGWADARLGRTTAGGAWGQFGLGLLLGAVWSPCVGPTLGAASVLASQGRDLGRVTATMAAFGVGAALPLLLVGSLSRAALTRWRPGLAAAGRGLKVALGIAMIGFAATILLGLDRSLEATLVEHAPNWLVGLSTRF